MVPLCHIPVAAHIRGRMCRTLADGLWASSMRCQRAPTLARVLGGPPVGDTGGDIGIVLNTTKADSHTYDPDNLNKAGVGIVAASASGELC